LCILAKYKKWIQNKGKKFLVKTAIRVVLDVVTAGAAEAFFLPMDLVDTAVDIKELIEVVEDMKGAVKGGNRITGIKRSGSCSRRAFKNCRFCSRDNQ
jgi:hypothetical protein